MRRQQNMNTTDSRGEFGICVEFVPSGRFLVASNENLGRGVIHDNGHTLVVETGFGASFWSIYSDLNTSIHASVKRARSRCYRCGVSGVKIQILINFRLVRCSIGCAHIISIEVPWTTQNFWIQGPQVFDVIEMICMWMCYYDAVELCDAELVL